MRLTTDGDLVPAAWTPPAYVTEDVHTAASHELATMGERFSPARMESARRWLASLGTLCKHHEGQNAEIVLDAYSGMLMDEGLPAGVFTKGSLQRATRKFPTWFPGYGDLATFLQAEAVSLDHRRSRLHAIVKAPTRRPNDDLPEEVDIMQRQKVGAFFSELAKGIAAAREGDSSRLEQMAREYGGEVRVKDGPTDALEDAE